MADNFLIKLFEHNNWANLKIIQVCSTLQDEQLDAEPMSATKGTIRRTLIHLVSSQQIYLALLTLAERPTAPLAFTQLIESARTSGDGLTALAKNEASYPSETLLRTKDDFFVEPWVVMLQAINHATEHREQINSMLSSLGITPLDLDGWSYGEAAHALVPIIK